MAVEKLTFEMNATGNAVPQMQQVQKQLSGLDSRFKKFQQQIARVSMVVGAGLVGALSLATKQAFSTIDSQAKLAQSLNTTVESMQVLARAGDLAGVSMGVIEQGTIALERRLSQAAGGAGPAVDALKRLGLTAEELGKVSLDKRIIAIQNAIKKFIPEAKRAAIAGQLFGDRAGLIFARLDASTLQQAASDISSFGIAVSEIDADNIERTNDAMTRLKLISTGVGNSIAIAVAPAMENFANSLSAIWISIKGPFTSGMQAILNQTGRAFTYLATFAAFMAGKWVVAFAAARVATMSLSAALLGLRTALIRTGIGAIVVLAGELIYQFSQLVGSVGSFGEAMNSLAELSKGVWDKIKAGGKYLKASLEILFNDISYSWAEMTGNLSVKWGEFVDDIAATKAGQFMGLEGGNAEAAQRLMAENLLGLNEKYLELLTTQREAKLAMDSATIGFKEFNDAINNAKDSGDLLNETTEDATESTVNFSNAASDTSKTLTEAQERMKSIADTMKDAFTSGFMSIIDGTKSAKDAFRDMARSIIAKLYEVLVVQRLVGSFDAATGTGTGLTGMLMNAFGGFRANGGPVSGGTPYVVGERGPELFVPSRSGTIVPNGAGGGVTVIQNNTFGNGVSRAEVQAMLPRIVETTKAAVFDAQRRSVNGLGYA